MLCPRALQQPGVMLAVGERVSVGRPSVVDTSCRTDVDTSADGVPDDVDALDFHADVITYNAIKSYDLYQCALGSSRPLLR